MILLLMSLAFADPERDREHPRSELVPDAHLAIAERLFETGDLDGAAAAYGKIPPESAYYPYATYKLAWTLYSLGDRDLAIEHLKRATAFESVQKQAWRDLVRLYAEAGRMDDARRFWADNHGDLALLGVVGEVQMDLGRYDEALATLRADIAADPLSPKALRWQIGVIESTRRVGRTADVVAEVERLRGAFGRKSAWRLANRATDADAEIERVLRENALRVDQEVRKTRATATFDHAITLFVGYHTEFPEQTALRKAFGDLLLMGRRHADAWDQYMAVLPGDPGAREASEQALVAARALLTAGEDAAGRRTAAAVERFVALHPGDHGAAASVLALLDALAGDPRSQRRIARQLQNTPGDAVFRARLRAATGE